ncbi:restriction endonuclease subunit S, partial [bacterium]|nr:restriction endonuclease subunit S [bacterium]
FEKDDILFGKLRPYLAKVWKSTFAGSAVGDIFILRPNKYIYPDFAFYRLISTQYIRIINGSTFGAKMPRASWNFIGDLPYPFPSTPEQKQIAKYLDHKTAQIDSLIEKKKRLIELLREERTAVINQAVTKGLDPNVPMKDSGIEWLGEIPAYWEVKKLKRSTTKITDGEHISPAFSSEGMPFLSAKDVRERDLNFDGDKFVSVEDGNKFRKRCDPERGDILLVSRGATIGRVGLVETDEKFCLLGSVILLKPIAKYSSLFLFYVLNTSRIQEQLLLTSQSSAQQAIYLVGVSELQIPVPPLDEQNLLIKHIEAEIIRIDTIISKSEKEIELLQEYRTALISEVVTGKIDVREERI